MTFGVCAGIEEADAVLAAGFDHVEVGASAFGAPDSPPDLAPYRGRPIPATNLFFAAGIALYGSGASYRPYAERTIARAALLGVRTMVVGSGAARRAADPEAGEREFLRIAGELGRIAAPYGVAIAPESLNRDETNVGVSLRALAKGLATVGVGFTADSYHVLREWDRAGRREPVDELWAREIPFRPTHVHVGPIDRGMPRPDDPHLRAFAARLRELGYDGPVSLEVNRPAGFGLPDANRALRTLFASEA